MFEWLHELGHSIEEPVPSLFTFNMPDHPITKLMGVSVEKARVKVAGNKLEQEGPLLITHWGLSGPAVLEAECMGSETFGNEQLAFSYCSKLVASDERTAIAGKVSIVTF